MKNLLGTILRKPIGWLIKPIIRDVLKERWLLAPTIRKCLEEQEWKPWHASNILKVRRELAGIETAEYVEEHLPFIQTVPDRFELLTLAAKHVDDQLKDGLILEFGVAGGRSINHISGLFPDHKIFGFDSFEGLPEDWWDSVPEGHFKQKVPETEKNVELAVGLFTDTLTPFLTDHPGPIRFLHIDSDLYESARQIFDELGNAERLKPGTVIVFDEYFNSPGWKQGEFKAFQDFIIRSGLSYEYLSYVRDSEQVTVKLKG